MKLYATRSGKPSEKIAINGLQKHVREFYAGLTIPEAIEPFALVLSAEPIGIEAALDEIIRRNR